MRIGLVGCGHMGRFHAAKFAESDKIEFVGCMDSDESKALDLSKRYKIKAFTDAEDMAGCVDAVSVAVPTSYHFSVASQFLKRKISVLLEKPISHDLQSAEKLVNVAESNDTVLQIGHSERFNPAFQAVREGIRNPKFIETHRLAPFKGRGCDVAVILDLMVHDLDLVLAMTGCMPDEVEAAGVAVITDNVDIANARLTFPGGCVANVTASRISTRELRKVRIFQKAGYTSIDMATRQAEQYVIVQDNAVGKFDKFGDVLLSPQEGHTIVRRTPDIPAGDNLALEISSFVDAVQGKRLPEVSGRDGLNVLTLAIEIEKLCSQYTQTI